MTIRKDQSDTIPDLDPDALRSDFTITLRRWWLMAKERAPILWRKVQVRLRDRRTKLITLSAAFAGLALLIVGIAAAIQDEADAPPVVGTAEIDRARMLVDQGQAANAVEILQRRLDRGDASEEPAIRAALGYAFAHERARLRALPHYSRAVERAPNVIRDGDIQQLVMMLVMQRPQSTEVEEILSRIGPRALPALDGMAQDDTRDPTLRRRARDLHQTISSVSSPST